MSIWDIIEFFNFATHAWSLDHEFQISFENSKCLQSENVIGIN